MAPLWVQAGILGLIQGLTEFLPVSSSGHLILLPQLTGWTYLGREFDVALHLGTLTAIAAYYREDLERLWEEGLRGRLLRQLVAASTPAAVCGFFLVDWLEAHFGGIGSVASLLALFGLILGWCERRGAQRKELFQLSMVQAWGIGWAQAVALVPGVSRCGATISAGLWLGLTRAEAARFSFLMALPVTTGACLFKLLKIIEWPAQPLLSACVVGILVSGLSGWWSIRFLMSYLRRHGFAPFVRYRLGLAIFLFLWMCLQQ